MSLYKVYIFQENDNIRLLLDRYNLLNDVIALYKQMNVDVYSQETLFSMSSEEKDMLNKFIENDIILPHTSNNVDTLTSVILHVKQMVALKKTLKSLSQTENIELNISGISQFIQTNPETFLKEKLCDKLPEVSSVTNEEQWDNHDTLECPFATVYDDCIIDMQQKTKTRTTSILYNSVYECVVICEYIYNNKIARISEEFPEFELIREYKDLDDRAFLMIKEYFANNMFCDKDVLVKKIESFENLYDIVRMTPLEKEKALIHYYIKSNYNISKDVHKRVKVSTLLDEVERDLNIKNANLKYKFASILTEIGLQKKRYADGMYLYGIESKSKSKIKNGFICESDLQCLLTARQEDDLKKVE